jgi:hypothetical protein
LASASLGKECNPQEKAIQKKRQERSKSFSKKFMAIIVKITVSKEFKKSGPMEIQKTWSYLLGSSCTTHPETSCGEK